MSRHSGPQQTHRVFLFPDNCATHPEAAAIVCTPNPDEWKRFKFVLTTWSDERGISYFCVSRLDSGAQFLEWFKKLYEVCQDARDALRDGREFRYYDFLGSGGRCPILRVEVKPHCFGFWLTYVSELTDYESGTFEILLDEMDEEVKHATDYFLGKLIEVASLGISISEEAAQERSFEKLKESLRKKEALR